MNVGLWKTGEGRSERPDSQHVADLPGGTEWCHRDKMGRAAEGPRPAGAQLPSTQRQQSRVERTGRLGLSGEGAGTAHCSCSGHVAGTFQTLHLNCGVRNTHDSEETTAITLPPQLHPRGRVSFMHFNSDGAPETSRSS